jgi:hypothetical protein
MNSKAWYLSKTLWANVAMIVMAVIDNAYFGAMIPADIKVYLVGAINLLLRFLTTTAVTVKPAG